MVKEYFTGTCTANKHLPRYMVTTVTVRICLTGTSTSKNFYQAGRGQDDKDTTPGGIHPQMCITASPLHHVYPYHPHS
jgi:hypothetical protein